MRWKVPPLPKNRNNDILKHRPPTMLNRHAAACLLACPRSLAPAPLRLFRFQPKPNSPTHQPTQPIRCMQAFLFLPRAELSFAGNLHCYFMHISNLMFPSEYCAIGSPIPRFALPSNRHCRYKNKIAAVHIYHYCSIAFYFVACCQRSHKHKHKHHKFIETLDYPKQHSSIGLGERE